MPRRLLLLVFSLFILAGCQKEPEQQVFVLSDVTIAVAPFTQPTATADLLAGFIPEDQAMADDKALLELDMRFRGKLHKDAHAYVFLKRSDVEGEKARDAKGRRSALAGWAAIAKKAGADMILVPQVISFKERNGSGAGVITPAAVTEDFFLIDAREPAALFGRSHFAEEQKALASDLRQMGNFFKRGASWVSGADLAAEGMDKAVKELGL